MFSFFWMLRCILKYDTSILIDWAWIFGCVFLFFKEQVHELDAMKYDFFYAETASVLFISQRSQKAGSCYGDAVPTSVTSATAPPRLCQI